MDMRGRVAKYIFCIVIQGNAAVRVWLVLDFRGDAYPASKIITIMIRQFLTPDIFIKDLIQRIINKPEFKIDGASFMAFIPIIEMTAFHGGESDSSRVIA